MTSESINVEQFSGARYVGPRWMPGSMHFEVCQCGQRLTLVVIEATEERLCYACFTELLRALKKRVDAAEKLGIRISKVES